MTCRVAEAQVALFSYITPGDSCKSRTVQFDASASTGPISTYEWSFRNLTTSSSLGTGTGKNITKNFLTPGVYEVVLKVSSSTASSSKTVLINVYKQPVVDFDASFKEGCPALSTTFQDKSTAGDGTITRWEWNYNDGKKDIFTSSTDPSHSYTSNGFYTPTLIVTNSFGCTNSLSKDKFISVYPKINPAFLTTSNYSCDTPHVATFENASPDSRFNFTWDFGDGTSVSDNSIFIHHQYEHPGVYSIKLTATNAAGNCGNSVQGSGVKNVYVGKPKAFFTIAPDICLGTSLTLNPGVDATGLSNEGKWFFEDDNSVYNGKTGHHTFNTVGTWKIKYITFNTYSGCYSDTAERIVNVLPTPTANFSVDLPNGCQVSHAVTFTNTSIDAASYSWNFGDGNTLNTDSDTAVVHPYTSFGTYQVTLTAKNAAGCSKAKTYNFIRIVKPTLDFDYTPDEGCKILVVKVKAKPNSIDPVVDYIYDFGNGVIDTISANEHSSFYVSDGTFQLTTSIITAQGCKVTSVSKPVLVNDFCDDDGSGVGGGGGGGGGGIELSNSGDCNNPYTFTFEDTLIHSQVISWDFDGVLDASGNNPVTYTFPDHVGKKKFIVTLTSEDLITHVISVRKIRVVVVDEKADFSMDRTDICKGLSIDFKPLGIDSSNIALYTWDFGDGSNRETISNKPFFSTKGPYSNGNTSYIYSDTGVFYPKLIIEDKFGCKDSIVSPVPVTVKGPVAKFVVDNASFCKKDFDVLFTDSSLANGTTPIIEWKWDFNDGILLTTDVDSLITHTYHNTSYYRQYKASLTIKDQLGCTDKHDTLIYSYAPKANFYTNDTLRCGKFNISFTNNSDAFVSNHNRFTWRYGNGNTTTGYNGSTVYADTGRFDITLIVQDDGGCIDSITKSSYVKLVKPKADFTIGSDTSKCVGTFSLPFVSTSTYSKLFKWDFGDGESSETDKIEVSHFYKIADTYQVKLVVTGLDGCKDSLVQPVKIKGPNGTLHVNDHYVCIGEQVGIQITGKNIKEYYWDFGDLSSTSDLILIDSLGHDYLTTGGFLPNVILISPENCQITLSESDSIWVDDLHAGPDANINCGDTHTGLHGISGLNIPGNYFWQGPSGVHYIADSVSLITQVDIPGEYILHVKDAACGLTDTVTVTTSGIVPDAYAGGDVRLDCISKQALLTGTTTTANTSMKWSGPLDAVFNGGDDISNPYVDKAGEYILTVTQKFCTTTDTVTVLYCSLLPTDTTITLCPTVEGVPARYQSFNFPSINSYIEGGIPSQVSWYRDFQFTQAVNTPAMQDVLHGETYFAKVVSMDGTEMGRARAAFVVHDFVKAQINFNKDTLCEVDGPAQLSAFDNQANTLTYEWYRDNILFDQSSQAHSFTYSDPLSSGIYVLKVYDAFCPATLDTFALKIYEQPDVFFPTEEINVDYEADKTIVMPIQVQGLQSTTVLSDVNWSPTNFLGYSEQGLFTALGSDTSIVNPLYLTQNLEISTRYHVTVTTGSGRGTCSASASVLVNNYIPPTIPNAFTPNGDGLNDTWIIRGLAKYPDTKVTVLNRWGNTLYENKDGYREPWDGTSNGEVVPFGTYYYVVDLKGSKDNSDHSVSGWLMVLQ